MSEVKTTTFHNKLSVAAVGMLVLGAVLVGFFAMKNGTDMIDFIRVGMFGWVFWAWVSLGMVGLTLLHHTVRGKWGAPMLRIWEAGSNPITLAFFGVVFLGIFLVAKEQLYEWTIPSVVANDAVLTSKKGYLDVNFFIARIVLYFAFFIFYVVRMSNWLRREEATGQKKWSDLRNNWSAPGIVFFVLCINFMMTDIGMSLDPHWFSTIYGIWQMIGMVLAGLSFAAMIVGSQSRKAPYNQVVNETLTRDIGNLMLAFAMVWAYFTLSQYLITYSGNLPEFNIYYVTRAANGWSIWGGIGVAVQFFVPFLLLLSPSMKRKPGLFATAAAWIFCARFVDLYYVFTPSLKRGMTPDNLVWMSGSMGMVLVFGAIWMILFVMHVKKKPLLTESHPYLAETNEEAAAHVA